MSAEQSVNDTIFATLLNLPGIIIVQVDIALQRHLTRGLPYMLVRDVVIAHFSRPPWGPICPWESSPLTCRRLGDQSAALGPAGEWWGLPRADWTPGRASEVRPPRVLTSRGLCITPVSP